MIIFPGKKGIIIDNKMKEFVEVFFVFFVILNEKSLVLESSKIVEKLQYYKKTLKIRQYLEENKGIYLLSFIESKNVFIFELIDYPQKGLVNLH